LGLVLLTDDRQHGRLYARMGLEHVAVPDLVPAPRHIRAYEGWTYFIVEDLRQLHDDGDETATRAGLRSSVRLPIRVREQLVGGLDLMSFEPGRFTASDVGIAARVADHIALALSHQRLADEARLAAEATARASHLESRVRRLTDELDARTGYRRILGESASWRQVLTQATQVATTEATVLLLGESGTGKEVVARFVHRGSTRRDGPFVALNCAALPEHLLEAELFGFERGAFTGATQTKPGQIEQASGGVLFLDEVGEMTLAAQAKFLRVLQEREFQRLGGNRVLRADVRVIAATNRDLRKAIERGAFREDLYYRLNVFALTLPPLRERRDDVLPLAEAFIQEIGRSLGRPPSGISREARQALLGYHWPGNVRELRNMLERAAILADGGLIVSEHLALVPPSHSPIERRQMPPTAEVAPVGGPPDLQSVERALIEKALLDARFNKSLAAKALGLTRGQLYTRLKRHGLE
jgi:transcriptional regulator with GAF, ATPase, and Fis domain